MSLSAAAAFFPRFLKTIFLLLATYHAMACLNSRISYASWRLRVFRQLFRPNGFPEVGYRAISTSNGTREPLRPTASSADKTLKSTPTENKEAVAASEEAEKGSKQHLRPSELLPQSPLLTNPRPGHDKLHKKKRRPDPKESDIHLNPWAQALASPLRACKVTGARVPRAFMSEWGFVQRPDVEDKLWLLPVGLMKDKLNPSSTTPSQEEGHTKDDNDNHNNKNNVKKNTTRHLTLRIVDRLPLLRTLTSTYWSTKTNRKREPLAKLLPHRWKHPLGPVTSWEESQLSLREDTPTFTLKMMRRDVVQKLKAACDPPDTQPEAKRRVWTVLPVSKYGRAHIARRTWSMEPFERMECCGVLVNNRRRGKPGRVTGLWPRMPEIVCISKQKKVAPVFDLTVMLGEEELTELREYCPGLFGKTAVVLRPDNKVTVDAMLALWRLRGFVRSDGVLEPPRMEVRLRSKWRSNYLL
ncbi:hypothetical protein ASPFODRAFT_127057 [Aspergillus luchuensis CBS 106.47]|uniref:Uncharacterized protein n=1 Tax=Aspergillus luchuensis (strain CBS 106.47) TaxID=1137211 RepID=A0A1M3TRC8_ASPLC|nr:hypothetical protein ASPFODRAFT_127057 [Aspergillus luchuensis CBS 106.47]